MEHNATNDKYQLSAGEFIQRACTLLLILFCLITIAGYIQLPFNAPLHTDIRFFDQLSGKAQVLVFPAIGILLYILLEYMHKHTYIPGRRFGLRNAVDYYNSISRFIGVFKLLVLFSGIIATAAFIHRRTINIDDEYNWSCKLLASLIIAVPIIVMMSEAVNLKKALIAKQ